jgi:hypothetical protein
MRGHGHSAAEAERIVLTAEPFIYHAEQIRQRLS